MRKRIRVNGVLYEAVQRDRDIYDLLTKNNREYLRKMVFKTLDRLDPRRRLDLYNRYAGKYSDHHVIHPMEDFGRVFKGRDFYDFDDSPNFHPEDDYFCIDEYGEPESSTEATELMYYWDFFDAILEHDDDLGNGDIRRYIDDAISDSEDELS